MYVAGLGMTEIPSLCSELVQHLGTPGGGRQGRVLREAAQVQAAAKVPKAITEQDINKFLLEVEEKVGFSMRLLPAIGYAGPSYACFHVCHPGLGLQGLLQATQLARNIRWPGISDNWQKSHAEATLLLNL